jgi:hypothetical protein
VFYPSVSALYQIFGRPDYAVLIWRHRFVPLAKALIQAYNDASFDTAY